MDMASAEHLIETLESDRRRARGLLASFWFPLILFGAVAMGSAVVIALAPGVAIAVYWAVAAPAGSVITAIWYRSRHLRVGLGANPWPYILLAITIIVGCFAVGLLGRGSALSFSGPMLVIGVGYLGYSWLERSPLVAVVAMLHAAAGVLLYLVRIPHGFALATALLGLLWVALGLWFAAREVPDGRTA
jgi:hypothetical protein